MARYGPLPRRPEDRFWEKVEKTNSCWNWIGCLTKQGYGDFHLGGGNNHVLAHRFSYELAHGELPPQVGLDHRCHNRRCVNPGADHLRLANQKQNMENLGALRIDNTSGFRGVSWNARTRRWVGRVVHNAKVHHLGYFNDAAVANAAVIAKRNELFTHNDDDRI